jgi:hypothetical protein
MRAAPEVIRAPRPTRRRSLECEALQVQDGRARLDTRKDSNLVTKLQIWTTVSVTVSALILAGFLWISYLAMEEFICFDRHPWW